MRDILTSPHLEKMKRTRRLAHRRLAILLSVFMFVLFGAMAYFSAYKAVTIGSIVVEGTQIIDASDIEKIAQQTLSGRYMYLFARSNSFIYPKQSLSSKLLTQFPRIATLSISRDSFTILHITITERSGASLYCGKDMPQAQNDRGEHCYYINNDGLIFDTAPYFSGNIYFKYYASHEGNPLGQQLFAPDVFHVLGRWIDRIEALGFKPLSLVVGADGTYTVYLDHAENDTEPKIICKSNADLTSIADNLTLAMSKPEFANEVKAKYSKLLYIDLRFKNKVLYKFNE